MKCIAITELDRVPADSWNQLAGGRNPFVRHEFLGALERNDCLGARRGWQPRHLLVLDNGEVVGALPQYVKSHSYGEFVFDWSWAEAYAQAGIPYYPKLVAAVPYTPVTGPRLLAKSGADASAIKRTLIEAALAYAQREKLSSAHWLFTGQDDTAGLVDTGLLSRTGCQFHWFNQGYRDFTDYLDSLNSKRRKQIKRERRDVARAGITVDILSGRKITPSLWATYERFYRSTFDRKWGAASLTLGFFQALGATLADTVVLVLARQRQQPVAAALCLRGSDTLYGRHWGAAAYYPSLHFELCYYQTIDYCIRHGLARFEAGAQGEHKVSRGFQPVLTSSAHWIADRRLRRAIADFVAREHAAVVRHIEHLREHLPFKQPLHPGAPGSRPEDTC
jgi:predicted N-acyltransferase